MASRTPTDLTNNELYDLEDAWNSFMFQCNGVGICWCLTGSFNDLVANFNEKKQKLNSAGQEPSVVGMS